MQIDIFEKGVVITGDCVEAMRDLMSDGSIDLTITSPPYDGLRVYQGVKQQSFDFPAVARELYRVTKQGGIVVWVVSDQTKDGSESGTSFRQALQFKEVGFNLHDTMIWHKTNPIPSDSRIPRYLQSFEYMFVLSKGKPKTCNHIRIPTQNAGKDVAKISNNYPARREKGMKSDQRVVSKTKIIRQDRVIHNVWDLPVHGSTDRYSVGHPAVFPEKLVADHITSWSNPGDIILDPFLGSGTVAKMATLMGRLFVGIEMSRTYTEGVATLRIQDAEEKIKCKTVKL